MLKEEGRTRMVLMSVYGTARRRGRAAIEGTIGQGIVSGQERLSEIPESTYEDQVDTNTNNGQEIQPLPEVVQEHYEEYLRSRAEEARGDSVEVNPGTPDSTEERTMGPY